MISGIHHVAMATADLGRLRDFYCGLLGFREEHRGHWDQGQARIDAMTGLPGSSADYVVLALGASRLELFRYITPQGRGADPDRPVCDAGITHICLQVDDIEAEYARLTAAGMRFHAPPGPRGGLHRATYGRDPDGNVIELFEVVVEDHPFGERIAPARGQPQ